MSAERVRELNQVLPQPISLDGFIGDDQDTRLSDVVADENADQPGVRGRAAAAGGSDPRHAA